jgi:hypothetical protein
MSEKNMEEENPNWGKTVEEYKGLLATLLNCGINDVDIILDIDADIVCEAKEGLDAEGLELNFPTLYYECASIALAREGIKGEIDSNYRCGCISIAAGHRKEVKALEELGFSVEVSE